jgi:hypothetical protein
LARGETDIVAFADNSGYLTWNNINTGLFYALEWRSSMQNSNAWNRSYDSLEQIQSSAATVTVYVPLFYRVRSASNRWVYITSLPKTGQTNVYIAADDGDFQAGTAWAVPRFSDNGNGTITDNNTGLMWLKSANEPGPLIWFEALAYCTNVSTGGYTDWRLPNLNELETLRDASSSAPCLPIGHPFTAVVAADYWTGTTYAPNTADAWALDMNDGQPRNRTKAGGYYVWPVRGGL